MKPIILIFGFGYTAKALEPKLLTLGFEIIGTSSKSKEYKQTPLNTKLIDFDSQDVQYYLSLASHLLISIPPNSLGQDVVLQNFKHLIKKQTHHFKWVGYLSSTGVYGDHQGQWVTEMSECIPQSPMGVARLKAENEWLSFAKKYQLPLHIFRLSGIYGPKRNALSRLIQGKKHSIFKQDQVFSRIHVEDIAQTLLASMQSPNPLSIYNVSDDEPAPAHELDIYAASLLQQEPPILIPFSKADLSPIEKEFYTNNRRVSNFKIKKELNVRLQYPTYKEGLLKLWLLR